MATFAKMVFVAAAMMTSGTAWSQIITDTTAATQQLQSGFLGEQNDRLSRQGDPAVDAFTMRAASAIGRKDYAGGLAILRQYRSTPTPASRFLSGQAYEGLGDYSKARKEYGAATSMRRNFTAGQVALGVLEAQHGDKAAAAAVLQQLTARRDACAGKCRDYPDLVAGVTKIEAALR